MIFVADAEHGIALNLIAFIHIKEIIRRFVSVVKHISGSKIPGYIEINFAPVIQLYK